jgi:hypothetical protein
MMENEQIPLSPDAGDIVVFSVSRDTACAECGRELFRGSMIMLNKERNPLCLTCADLDHLEYLSRRNATLTRRASKHSRLRAVVVKWSTTRKRYERQGVLVDPEAVQKAEAECFEDAEWRERQRDRRRTREAEIDHRFVAEFARQIRMHFPGSPAAEAKEIAEHACRKYSGRVGRSAAAKEFDPTAIRLAVMASVPHRFTNYDELLLGGYDRYEARAMVRPEVDALLENWSTGRRSGEPPQRGTSGG